MLFVRKYGFIFKQNAGFSSIVYLIQKKLLPFIVEIPETYFYPPFGNLDIFFKNCERDSPLSFED